MSLSRNLGSIASNTTDGTVNRTMLNANAKNWTLLGTSGPLLVPAIRILNPVVWTGAFQQLMVEYYIAGYSNTAIARVLFGTGVPAETTGTCFCNLTEITPTATANAPGIINTSTVTTAISGIPTAITLNNAERWGMFNVNNQAGKNKRITGQGQYLGGSAGTSATTAPTSMRHDAIYNVIAGTIQQVSLVSYGDITTNALSANTLSAGSYINVWGRNND